MHYLSLRSRRVSLVLVTALLAGPVLTATAIDIGTGEIDGRLDTTLSVGASWRVEDRDPDLIGVVNGGRGNSINSDNGNLNYDKGDVISESVKILSELELSWRNIGFFGRAFYFYDYAVMDRGTDRTPLSKHAEDALGEDFQVLDAYITADFDLLDHPVTLRFGDQVLSWGESTFIQNGINVINPVDVSKLRVAGAELRDALVPVPMVSANADLTGNLSIEGFYQLKWERTEIEPAGTFFSTSDHASPGAQYVFLGFGQPPATDNPRSPIRANPPVGTWVEREDDHEPGDDGQGGIALRYFAPSLNDTEFGLFFIRYHSRLPVLSGRAGGSPPKSSGLTGFLDLIDYGLHSGDYASKAEYFREYPEDIDVLGLSFNTEAGSSGVAIQGEVTYRWDQPLQVDDVELLFAAISPLDRTLRHLKKIEGLLELKRVDPPINIFGRSQLGAVGWNEEVQGYRRKDIVQPQMTVTKLFGPTLGADQIVLIGEVGATWILDMEGNDELRYEGPGTFTGADPFFTEAEIQPATQEGGFADDFSCGYRIATRADFNNAIGAVTLQPAVAFYHDVEGTTPLPIANFVDDRKVVTVSLGADYLNAVRAKLAYTTYFGGGNYNLVNDRDFVSVTASYSF